MGQEKFNPRAKRFNRIAGNPPQQQQPPAMSPEQSLHIRAITRLEMLPPYQSLMPYEMTLLNADGGQQTRQFKGLTKREHMVIQFIAAQIQKDGLPLQDGICQSYVRTALVLSEHVLQGLSKARGEDTTQIKKELTDEDASKDAPAKVVD